jgi:hypothetical protein
MEALHGELPLIQVSAKTLKLQLGEDSLLIKIGDAALKLKQGTD